MAQTLFDKIWSPHVEVARDHGTSLLWIDRHLLHDGGFHGLGMLQHARRVPRRPDLTFGVGRPSRAVAAQDRANIDTDQIVPTGFQRKPRAEGYNNFLFHDMRGMSDAGVRCVISPGFGDIFAGSGGKKGLLTAVLPNRQLRAANSVHAFEIHPFRKRCLLAGLDDIGQALANNDAIAAFEAADRAGRAWAGWAWALPDNDPA